MRKTNKILVFFLVISILSGFTTFKLYAQDNASDNTEKKEFTIEQYKALADMITALQNKVEELNKKSSTNLEEAKTYANTLASSTKQNCQELVSSNLEASISYTDNKANTIITEVKTYANSLASSTEKACKELIAPEVETVKTYAEEKANKALTDAKTYTDEKANKALTDAKTYAEEKANKALTDAKSYIDTNSKSDAVTAIGQGSKNGSISVTANGNTTDVEIKGLGSAAYTNSEDYAKAKHSHTTDSSMSATSKNPVQNKVIKEYIDAEIKKAMDTTLKSAKEYTDSCTKGDFSINKDSGYIKLPNGVIIQWINNQKCNASGNTVVKLPTPFTSTNYSVTASTISNNDAVFILQHQIVCHSKSMNNFVVTTNNQKGAQWDCLYQFIAIGK